MGEAPADPRSPEVRRPGLVLAVIGIGTLLSALAGSAVTLTLPEIGRVFDVSLRHTQWVLQSFLLSTTALMLPAGRLADMLGHRRVYLCGFVTFALASAACGVAPGFGWLVAGRVVQGMGGALVMASSPALLTTSFPAARRGRALGMLATATYTGLTLGPPTGGLLVGGLGWRWVFFLNVPVAIVVLALGLLLLPRSRPRPAALDLPGTAALVAGLPLLLLSLSLGRGQGGAGLAFPACLAGGLLLLAIFGWVERRHRSPLLDLGLFRSAAFTGAALSAVLNYVALFVPIILLPFFLTEGLGTREAGAGLLLAAQPLAMALVASPSGALSDRLGSRSLATAGMLAMALALLGLATLGPGVSHAGVAARLALLGLGTGIFISPNSSALMGAAPPQRQGIAGGVLAVARNLGMLLGVALAAALFHALGGETGGQWDASEFGALRLVLVVAAGIALLGAVTAFVGQRRR